MTAIYSFGEWIKQQRKRLRLTQREVAECCHCSIATIKKIETDQRRPSPELAELLASTLNVPPEKRDIFIQCARGQRPVDALASAREDTVEKSVPQTFRRPAPLPLSTTPFIGRADELAYISGTLADPTCRLLTLAGPGGVGKTRLALAAALAQQENFRDGVVFIPLTAIDDPGGIAPAIAKALNQPLAGSDPAEIQLQRLLRARELLLVLDNFEHLVEGASLLADWLTGASGLKLLVTSRERLNLAEEWLYAVTGFNLEQAVQLFARAAQRMHPYFDLAEQEAAIADICRLVDGLPLATELAAGWTRLMPCDQIAAHIRQDLDFLSTGPRNAPERHRSLRALYDHSWQLLSSSEQAALAGLSIFRGGFSPEEAAAVAGAGWPILLGLADKSLVMAQANGRYDLHELTRQYAAAKLQATGKDSAVQKKHFDTYLTLAERLDAQLHGPDGIAAFTRLDQEHDNLRAALKWGLKAGQVKAVLRFVNCLFFFWLRRGYWREGEQWNVAAVSQAGEEDDPDLCVALIQLSTFIAIQGRHGEAGPYLPRAIPMARRLEQAEPLLLALITLGQAVIDPQEAYAVWDEAIAIAEGDKKLTWQLATIQMHYGDRLRENGHYTEATARYRQSLKLMEQIGNVDMIAYPLGNLGLLALHQGRLEDAHKLIAESVTISRATGNRLGMGDWVFRLGLTLLYLERTDEAATALHEALEMYQDMDNQRGQASVLACLAQVALNQENVGLAARHIEQSLSTYHDLHRQMQQASAAVSSIMSTEHILRPDEIDSLLRAVLVFSAQQHFEQAATLFGFTESLSAQSGHTPALPLQASVDEAILTIREQMSEESFIAAKNAGQMMPPDEIFAVALRS